MPDAPRARVGPVWRQGVPGGLIDGSDRETVWPGCGIRCRCRTLQAVTNIGSDRDVPGASPRKEPIIPDVRA